MITDFTRVDLSIPLIYHGDAKEVLCYVKNFIENNGSMNLGAPFGYEEPQGYGIVNFLKPFFYPLCLVLIKIISLFTDDVVRVVNYYYLLSFILTALFFLFAIRHFKISVWISVVFSILYAFLSFHFVRSVSHFWVMSYYNVPLMVLILIWMWSEKPIFFTMKKNAYGLDLFNYRSMVCIVVVSFFLYTTPYYSFIFAFLLLVSGISASFYRKNIFHLISVFMVILLVCFSLFKAEIPLKIYQVIHKEAFNTFQAGKEIVKPGQVISTYGEDEYYGMKLVQLFLPVQGHRCAWMERFNVLYNKARCHIVNENSAASLGVIGVLGFFLLLMALLFHHKTFTLLQRLSILNIFTLLLATVGGFSSLFSTVCAGFFSLDFPLIQARAYNRASVFLACLSFFALALFFEKIKDSLNGAIIKDSFPRRMGFNALFFFVLAVLLALGLYDQTTDSFKFTYGYEARKIHYESDRAFIHGIEKLSGSHAVVFQLPFTTHHMGRMIGKSYDSDGYTGYIHSDTLRWSYGADKASAQARWYESVAGQTEAELIRILLMEGFSGLLIDRFAFADRGERVESEITLLLNLKPIESDDLRYSYFPIQGQEVLSGKSGLKDSLLQIWTEGFYDPETVSNASFRWCGSRGKIKLKNYSNDTQTVLLSMEIGRLSQPGTVLIQGDSFVDRFKAEGAWKNYQRVLRLEPGGETTLAFSSGVSPVKTAGIDSRTLVFAVSNFTVKEFDPQLFETLNPSGSAPQTVFHFPADLNNSLFWSGRSVAPQGLDNTIDFNEWLNYLHKLSPGALVRALLMEEVSGILIHGNLLDGNSRALETNIADLLNRPSFVFPDQEYVFFDLNGLETDFCKSGDVRRPTIKTSLESLYLAWDKGFYETEQDGNRNWRWCGGTGKLYIKNYSCTPLNVRLSMEIGWLSRPGSIVIKGNTTSVRILADSGWHPHGQIVSLAPGTCETLTFFSDTPPVNTGSDDSRILAFALSNVTIKISEE